MKLVWTTQKDENAIEKVIQQTTKTCDNVLLIFFRSVYFLGRKTTTLIKFLIVYDLHLVCKSTGIESLYHDEKC
jgi:hypothetical protein